MGATAMQRTPTILIVSPDPRLGAEVDAALKGITDTSAVVHRVPDFRQGAEAARSRRPDFVLVEMGRDLRALKVFAEEVTAGSPETRLAAVFAPDLFGPDVSESAILIEAVRVGMQDFLRRPVSRADLEEVLERLHRRQWTPSAPRSGRIVSFISNKGGVGKSTLATNVACGLALSHPGQVLLIDASLQMGVCSALLDLRPPTSFTDAVRGRDRLDETLIRQLATPHECGLHLLAAPADAVEAAEIDDQVMARILTLARRAYDYTFVDTFPMLDQVMMAVLDLSDRAYVVLESVVPTVLGVARLIQLLDRLGFPRQRQRVVVNRYTGAADNLKPADLVPRLGRDIDYVVSYNAKVPIAANIGKPYILGASRFWGPGKVLHQMVREVESIEHLRPAAAMTVNGAATETATAGDDGVRVQERMPTLPGGDSQ